MSKKVPIKTIYYSDETNDDFSGIKRDTITIDEKFVYANFKNRVWKFFALIVYRVIMLPIAFLYCKIKFGLKIQNKRVLKKYRHDTCFLYGNHTQVPGDGFIQALVSFPNKSYVVVNADNVSLKGTTNFMLMVGAMPLPTTVKGYKSFFNAISDCCKKGRWVVIYPEAHIWPYYTGIRSFSSTSLSFPVKNNKPAFAFTAVYKKRRLRKSPKIIIKVDGPFFPDTSLPLKDAEKKLRDEVYESMLKSSLESNYEYIKYVRQD